MFHYPEGNGLSDEMIKSQIRMEEVWRRDQHELAMLESKTRMKIEMKMWEQKMRQQLKEEREVRRRSVYEEVKINQGVLEVKTQNLEVEDRGRIVSNLRYPSLSVIRTEGTTDEVYLISGDIGQERRKIYLLPEKTGCPSYLIRKFRTMGAGFYASTSMAKIYSAQLLELLLASEREILWVASRPGWMEMPNGAITYVEQGGILWSEIKRLAK